MDSIGYEETIANEAKSYTLVARNKDKRRGGIPFVIAYTKNAVMLYDAYDESVIIPREIFVKLIDWYMKEQTHTASE